MRDGFDVVIVGAGPAGASCAKRACELGLSVLVLEAAVFPRSKPCAAGLTTRAVELLGDGVGVCFHDSAQTLRLRLGAVTLRWTGEIPVIRTTTRREFDSVLADEAAAAGAIFVFGSRVDGVVEDADCVNVAAGGRIYRGRFVVGADGAGSVVAHGIWGKHARLSGAVYVRALPPSSDDLAPHRGVITLDPTATTRGYGWVFPKNDHLNVGVYAQRSLSKALTEDLKMFLETGGFGGWRTEGPFAAPIPVTPRAGGPTRGRVLLAGDAAGLADPVAGEGIPHAVASGRIAAEAIAAALERGGSLCVDYSRRILSEVVPCINARSRAGGFIYRLGPRGIERAARVPFLRWALARLGPSGRAGAERGTLRVEYTPGRSPKQ
jgi:geranylgeranyl reductase family protein